MYFAKKNVGLSQHSNCARVDVFSWYEIFALREILAFHFISYNNRLHIIVSWFDKQRLLLKLSIYSIYKW